MSALLSRPTESVQASGDHAVKALVDVLKTIDPGRPSQSMLASGHYAAVLRLTSDLAIAITTDGVGTKLILAQELGVLDTVGIDCVAMNVNDLICVGAAPTALVDYLAVESADIDALTAIARGLKAGAEQAMVEIPGGELAVLPDLIQGHPSPGGFDLAATCIGTVAPDRLITGENASAGDVVIGIPSSGLHSNGYTIARHVLSDAKLELSSHPPELGGQTIGEALLAPTTIYVRAVLELLASDLPVAGLAHITGGGIVNLLRLNAQVGVEITAPLPVPPIIKLIADHGNLSTETLWREFNMGCGFCVVAAPSESPAIIAHLNRFHPGSEQIGRITDRSGVVTVDGLELTSR